ncbi:MAG TPA: protein kinase, partial [Candidatus Ozemobacteraceae bacterium]|nr:protein kinase [Candidatus Ozemobacteraceae bacterium]
MIGTVINGKYEIRQSLSESHQFEVFSALEVETGTTVVLKLMLAELAERTDRVRLFADEVAQFARVDHPGVARVLDLDMTGSRPFVVTEFVKGTDLLSWVQNGPVSFNEATKALQGIATVLQAAYDQGILCRSVKLSNVLRTAKGEIKVLSFSLPRLKLVGREDADPAASIQSDLYFLGTAYYELLTGESAIRRRGGLNECWDEKLRQAMRIRHPHLNPEQVDRLVALIDSTLTRDINRRCKDHAAFLVGLADLLHLSESSSRQNKATGKKQFASAAEVVDAIQGRMLATGTGDAVHFSSAQPAPMTGGRMADNVVALNPSAGAQVATLSLNQTLVRGDLSVGVSSD